MWLYVCACVFVCGCGCGVCAWLYVCGCIRERMCVWCDLPNNLVFSMSKTCSFRAQSISRFPCVRVYHIVRLLSVPECQMITRWIIMILNKSHHYLVHWVACKWLCVYLRNQYSQQVINYQANEIHILNKSEKFKVTMTWCMTWWVWWWRWRPGPCRWWVRPRAGDPEYNHLNPQCFLVLQLSNRS